MKVVGRIWWDKKHPSPWMTFKHKTAYIEWFRKMRKVRPDIVPRYDYAFVDTWTPEAMLQANKDRES